MKTTIKLLSFYWNVKNWRTVNHVVSHELAKAYFEDNHLNPAQQSAVVALVAEPENIWYLHTLLKILNKQGVSFGLIESSVPFKNKKLKENLALLYFKNKKYAAALVVLKEVKKSTFKQDLQAKIKRFNKGR